MKSSWVQSRDYPRETGRSWVGPAYPLSCFRLTRGSHLRVRAADRAVQKVAAFCPKASLVPTLNNTIDSSVSYSNVKIPPNLYTHVRIHPYPLQSGHIPLLIVWDAKMSLELFRKFRPTGRIRGSNARVEKMVSRVEGARPAPWPVSHESIGIWRVGSGQEVYQISLVKSGRVKRF